jgi:hypothetical protein
MDIYKANVSLIISGSTTLLEAIGLIVADYAWSDIYQILPRFYITGMLNYHSPDMINCDDIKSCYENLLAGHCVLVNLNRCSHINIVSLLVKIACIDSCDAAAWIHQHIPIEISNIEFQKQTYWATPIPECVEFMKHAPINRYLSRFIQYTKNTPIGDRYVTYYQSFDMSPIKYIQVLVGYRDRSSKYYRPESKSTGILVYDPKAIAFVTPDHWGHIISKYYRDALFFESEEKAFSWVISTGGWVLHNS